MLFTITPLKYNNNDWKVLFGTENGSSVIRQKIKKKLFGNLVSQSEDISISAGLAA